MTLLPGARSLRLVTIVRAASVLNAIAQDHTFDSLLRYLFSMPRFSCLPPPPPPPRQSAAVTAALMTSFAVSSWATFATTSLEALPLILSVHRVMSFRANALLFTERLSEKH